MKRMFVGLTPTLCLHEKAHLLLHSSKGCLFQHCEVADDCCQNYWYSYNDCQCIHNFTLSIFLNLKTLFVNSIFRARTWHQLGFDFGVSLSACREAKPKILSAIFLLVPKSCNCYNCRENHCQCQHNLNLLSLVVLSYFLLPKNLFTFNTYPNRSKLLS